MSEDYLRDPNYKVRNQNSQTRAIQKAYTQVQADMQRELPENEATTTISVVVGTQAYALPTDFARLKLVRFNGDVLLETSQKAIKMQHETMTEGTPDTYYLYGGQLYVHPVPNLGGTIDVDYYASAAMIDGSTTSALPTDFNDAICLFATSKLMSGVGKADMGQQFRGDYMSEIMKLRGKYWMNDEKIARKDGTAASMISEKGISYKQ